MKKTILISAFLLGLSAPAAFAATTPATTGNAQEISRSALKMDVAQMKDHTKVGSISGRAATSSELEMKFSISATMMGAKYYVITSLNNNNYAYGTADFYN
ncbi:DUF1471 domain-containing protein [Rahnella bruchi]|uniref:DUF1471 domain-containing protein n=1 Tax=Rahnella bruchi TaxID=1510573 RepID=UPI000EA1931D|nr:DUF1471 domain-containing protein [Rahnella bruchi]